jgi:hypothetical protein
MLIRINGILIFALFVLDMYFFFSLLGVNKEKKKYQEKEKSTQPIRICMDFSAQNCTS